jgi:hypothetical protein
MNFRGEKAIKTFWWLTPVILATQDSENSRIAVQSQPSK